MRITLRLKLLFFSSLLALIPIAVAGGFLIKLVENELKSSVNDELLQTTGNIAEQIDLNFVDSWLGPLQLLKRTIDNPDLDARAKLAALSSISAIEDLVALQLSVEGLAKPVLITQDGFSRQLMAEGIDPATRLRLSAEQLDTLLAGVTEGIPSELHHVPELNRWLLSVVIELDNPIQERRTLLSASFDLQRLLERTALHPFSRTGNLLLIERHGKTLLGLRNSDNQPLLDKVTTLLEADNNSAGAITFNATDGSGRLGGYAFSSHLPWAVIAERDARTAYQAVRRMLDSLLLWMLFGLSIAVIGAILFARRISQPVVAIAQVAQQVGDGDLDAEVPPLRSRDEIGTLGRRINEMIAGLRERERVKDIFGRYQTPEVMRTLLSSQEALGLGGESRRITVMMTDLRGFTALSERLEPQEVVRLLNHYFEYMVEICARHNGTINEIIGDGLLVFFGAPMRSESHERQAVACALEMQIAMEEVNSKSEEMGLPRLEMGIGLNTGEVVVGNIGSSKRAKYAAVGSDVNLTARIESYTVGGEILVSGAVLEGAGEGIEVIETREVKPKGVKEPMPIYSIGSFEENGKRLALAREEEQFSPLESTLDIRFNALEGKHLGNDQIPATLTALSKHAALMNCDELPEPLVNLMLNLDQSDLAEQPIYAKVMAHRDGQAVLRFTSVPEPVSRFLAERRG